MGTSNYARYMAEHAMKKLEMAMPTAKRRNDQSSDKKAQDMVGNIGKTLQGMLLDPLAVMVKHHRVEEWSPAVPTYDVYETGRNFLQPKEDMSPHTTWDSYLDAAFHVAAEGETGPIARLVSAFSETQRR